MGWHAILPPGIWCPRAATRPQESHPFVGASREAPDGRRVRNATRGVRPRQVTTRLRFVGGLPIGCSRLPRDDAVSATVLAVGIAPVSGDCGSGRRARVEEYGLAEALPGPRRSDGSLSWP